MEQRTGVRHWKEDAWLSFFLVDLRFLLFNPDGDPLSFGMAELIVQSHLLGCHRRDSYDKRSRLQTRQPRGGARTQPTGIGNGFAAIESPQYFSNDHFRAVHILRRQGGRSSIKEAGRRGPGASSCHTYTPVFEFVLQSFADAPFRVDAEDAKQLKVRNADGDMAPLGAVVDIRCSKSCI
jgi:hypothetical protein